MNTKPPVQRGPFLEPFPALGAGARHYKFKMSPTGGVILPPSAPVLEQGFAVKLNGTKTFAVGTSSIKIIDEGPGLRSILHFRTVGLGTCYIEFGVDATTNSVLRLATNEQMLFDVRVPQDDIYVVGDAASVLSVQWGVMVV